MPYKNKEDQKKWDAQYYKANRAAISERNAQYRKANRAAISERNAQYYKANRAAILEQRAQYYKANEQKTRYYKANRAKYAQYYITHRAAKAEYQARWYQKQKDKRHVTIPKMLCQCCAQMQVSGKRYGGVCATCEKEGAVMPRTEHVFIGEIATCLGFPASSLDHAVTGPACKDLERRRPDGIWVSPNRDVVVIVEIDEDSHASRQASCEIAKISQQNEAIQRCEGLKNAPVYTLRVNPDAFDGGRVTKAKRIECVAKRMREIMASDSHERDAYQCVEYFFYHSKARHLIDEQAKYVPVRVVG